MKTSLILFFSFFLFISFAFYSQDHGTIKVTKNDLIGKWVKIKTDTPNFLFPKGNGNSKVRAQIIDTLYFYSDHTYLERKNNKGASAKWSIEKSDKPYKYDYCIKYENWEDIIYSNGKKYLFKLKGSIYQEFRIISSDTLSAVNISPVLDSYGIDGEIIYYIRAK